MEIYEICVHPDYRELTEKEQEVQLKAMEWLHKKKVPVREIALLSLRNLDREGKRVRFEITNKLFTYRRIIRYENSPLDDYLTGVFPCLKVKPFVFCSSAWTKRKPTLGFHVREDRLRAYLDRKSEKKVLGFYNEYDKIEITKKLIAHSKLT